MTIDFTRHFAGFATCLCLSLLSTVLLAQRTQVVPPPSNDMASQLGCTLSWNGQGMAVGYVSPGSPAQQAGLETGDVIVGVGQSRMQDANSFQTALVSNPGQAIQLTVINVRNGQYVQVWIRVGGGSNVTPPPAIGPPGRINPPPQAEIYSIELLHPVTGGVVFSTTRSSNAAAQSVRSAYLKYHWKIWKYNGIEEDIKYKRFRSAAQAHSYPLTWSLLGFYINKVEPGKVTIRQIQ